MGILDLEGMKERDIGIGAVIQSTLDNGKFIFSEFVKENSGDVPKAEVACNSLTSLWEGMERAGIKTVSIYKVKDGLDQLHWLPIESSLKNRWNNDELQITICTGEVITPPIEDQITIVSETHDSAVGGQKMVFKTYGRVWERFYWQGMKKDITYHVSTCE